MSAGELQIGSRIGAYEVLQILGVGGMGKVYKVRNRITDRIEAMKVLLPDLAQEPGLADRFLREIKVLASLQHPNIAGLHTAECIGNQLIMLIEYLDGVTLDQKIGAGPLPASEAVRYVAQVLAALDYAHARGVIHRDIKPSNMLVTAGGIVKLLDFGIAKTEDRRLTQTGVTMGSLYYMSPEQIRADSHLDSRSDLYSVGVSLYELVTGKHPFDGDSQYSIMSAHLKTEPVPPVQVDPSLPAFLSDAILKAVAKEPNARFQTAGAFATALGQAAAPSPAARPVVVVETTPGMAGMPVAEVVTIEEPRPIVAEATRRPSRMRGVWLAAGAALAAGVVIGLIQFGPKAATNASPSAAEPVSLPSQYANPPASSPAPPANQAASQAAQQTPQQPVRTQAQASAVPPVTAPAATPAGCAPEGNPTPAVVPPSPPQPNPAASAALQEARDRLVVMEARAGSMHDSLEALKKSQAALGVGLRSDLQLSSGLMDRYLGSAGTAIKAGDAEAAKQSMDKAEPEIKKLEQNFGK